MARGTIGQLRHRAVIERLTKTPDGQGGFTASWSSFATVWAEIKPVSASERLRSDRNEILRTHKMRIRFLAGVSGEMRVIFDDRIFQVKGFITPDEHKDFMFMDLQEGIGA